MKNYWYLVASLPTLRIGEKPAMSVAEFRAACAGQLEADEIATIEAVLENCKSATGTSSTWWNGEVQLRDAVARLRAKERGVDASPYLQPVDGLSVALEKMVTDAFTHSNPMEREMELDRARWVLAEESARADAFAFPAILAYAVQVRIATRWAEMDDTAGQTAVEALIDQATLFDNEQEKES